MAPVLLVKRDVVPAMGDGVANVNASPADGIGTLDDLLAVTWESYASDPYAYRDSSQGIPASVTSGLPPATDHASSQDWALEHYMSESAGSGSASTDVPLLTSLAATSTPDFTIASVSRLAMSLPAGSGSYASAGGGGGAKGGSPGSDGLTSETGGPGSTPLGEDLTKRGSAPHIPPDPTNTNSSDSEPGSDQPGDGFYDAPYDIPVIPATQYPEIDAPVSVPEPGTGALLLCALASYWACGRRKV